MNTNYRAFALFMTLFFCGCSSLIAEPTEKQILAAFTIGNAYRLKASPKGRQLPGDVVEWLHSYTVRGTPEPLLDVSVALLRRAVFTDPKALERIKQISPESFSIEKLPSGRKLIHLCLDDGSGGTTFSAIIYDPSSGMEFSASATQRWSEGDLKPIVDIRKVCIHAAKVLEPSIFIK